MGGAAVTQMSTSMKLPCVRRLAALTAAFHASRHKDGAADQESVEIGFVGPYTCQCSVVGEACTALYVLGVAG